MSSRYSSFMLAGCLAGSVVGASPAVAQEKPQGGDAAAATDGDIIVTAQRRAERAQSIPMSISTATAAVLEQANIKSAMDVSKLVPGVRFAETSGAVLLYIRGIGSNQVLVGNEGSNALYIDGVFYSRVTPITMRLNSVERIEVLKGPQGTLFGRNSTGGLIQIVTREPKPGLDPEMQFSVGLSNYKTVDTTAYMSASLGSKVAADLSLIYSKQNEGAGKNLVTGAEVFKTYDYAARSKVVFTPTENTKFVVTGYYDRSRSDTSINGYQFPYGAVRTGFPDGSGLLPLPENRFDVFRTAPAYTITRNYGGNLRIEQELGFATLVNITAFNNLASLSAGDIDLTPINLGANFNPNVYERRYINETQLFSNPGSAIKWTVGAFYMRQYYGYNPANLIGTQFGGQLVVTGKGLTKSYAGYAQATIPITDTLDFTVGGRYSQDDLKAQGKTERKLANGTIVPVVPLRFSSRSFGKFIWKLNLNYHPSNDLLVYATQSRGSKTGQYSLVTFDPNPVTPETLDNYELGFKSQLFDRRLRLNGALFYYKVKDLQVQRTDPVTRLLAFQNAGAARGKGAEIEANLDITPDFSINGAATYLDVKYTDFPNAPFFTANPNPPFGHLVPISGSAAGNRLARAPRFSGNAGFRYSIPTTSGNIVLSANYSYSGAFFYNPDNRLRQPAFGLLDAKISYEFAESAKVSVWGTNITDKPWFMNISQQTGSPGAVGSWGAPRRYGVTLDYKFR